MKSLEDLERNLKESGVLKTKRIIDAFNAIDRKDFVLEVNQDSCYEDRPLDIGHGQTISQPTTVSFMFELLQPQPGEKILDVGSGSGWTTALLTHVVGKKGEVWGVERIPELVNFGKRNLSKLHFAQADILRASDVLGLPAKSPFDKILVSAGDTKIPEELVGQLKAGGVMVIPIEQAIVKITKRDDGIIETERFEGFIFVPLIH